MSSAKAHSSTRVRVSRARASRSVVVLVQPTSEAEPTSNLRLNREKLELDVFEVRGLFAAGDVDRAMNDDVEEYEDAEVARAQVDAGERERKRCQRLFVGGGVLCWTSVVVWDRWAEGGTRFCCECESEPI